MSDAQFESALTHAQKPTAEMAIDLSEVADRGMLDLRGSLEDKAFKAAVKSALGFDLPATPRGSAHKDGVTALWLSVDQWLICCERHAAAALLERLSNALAQVHSLVVDVSDARSIIRLKGESAREVLMKGMSVDLMDPAYGEGSVRRVQFAEIAALIHIIDAQAHTIDLYIFRSYADYAWNWLCATGTRASQVRLFAEQNMPAN